MLRLVGGRAGGSGPPESRASAIRLRDDLQEASGCYIHGATLVIAKLDRLARNVAFISNLMDSGVEFTAVDFPQANRLTVHILAAVAEHERELIASRTKAALASAKARGRKLGGNRGGFRAIRDRGHAASVAVRSAKADKRAADLVPMIRELQSSGASLHAIAAELTRRGIETPRKSGSWKAVQVKRILDRQDEHSLPNITSAPATQSL